MRSPYCPVYVDRVSSADSQDYRDLARGLLGLLDVARRTLSEEEAPSELVARVTGHLGCELPQVVAVHERFQIWDHVNIQRGIDAYLARHGSDGTWFGMATGMMRPHQDLLARLATPGPAQVGRAGSASYGTAATGPDTDTEVVTLGLIATTAPGGAPAVIGMRAEREFGPPHGVLEILAADRDAASATRAEITRLTAEHNVFRGQVLSFAQSEHHGNELVSFLPRIPLAPGDVVLPAGLLESIERHAAGVGDLSAELRAAGQHLKRGLLLYGPPGTGKTHTVRYLLGQMTGYTRLVLTGRSLVAVGPVTELARALQPAVVVLEDVDLVAEDRTMGPRSSPVLFDLLDSMDGAAPDADLLFLLTTNRADLLEPALAARPGRVDVAVEISLPDAPARERLLTLYGQNVPLSLTEEDVNLAVERTDGTTASFLKELIRRSVLESLHDDPALAAVTGAHLARALDDLLDAAQAVTRTLLGVGVDPAKLPAGGVPSPIPGRAWLAYGRRGMPRRFVQYGG